MTDQQKRKHLEKHKSPVTCPGCGKTIYPDDDLRCGENAWIRFGDRNRRDSMNIAKKIMTIADHYGYDAQSRQCMEEMAELTQAINKFWRVCGNGQKTEKGIQDCRDNLTEEMADVQIMLWQMEYLLLSGQEVNQMIEKKLDRQLKRIEEE